MISKYAIKTSIPMSKSWLKMTALQVNIKINPQRRSLRYKKIILKLRHDHRKKLCEAEACIDYLCRIPESIPQNRIWEGIVRRQASLCSLSYKCYPLPSIIGSSLICVFCVFPIFTDSKCRNLICMCSILYSQSFMTKKQYIKSLLESPTSCYCA